MACLQTHTKKKGENFYVAERDNQVTMLRTHHSATVPRTPNSHIRVGPIPQLNVWGHTYARVMWSGCGRVMCPK